MIEATCTTCGNINRVAVADIPVGAKFVNCSSCKSRVALPTKTAAGVSSPGGKPPPIPGAAKIELGAPGAGMSTPGVKTEHGLGAPSGPPTKYGKPEQNIALGAPGGKTESGLAGLADLPAPKRSSALGGESSKPAPRSGLAAALDADLPAPVTRKSGTLPAASPFDVGSDALLPHGSDLGRSDLPAPKSSVARGTAADAGADLPAPKARALTDLPAPRTRTTAGVPPPADDFDAPTTRTPPAALADLPAPKSPAALVDLPAPKRSAAVVAKPTVDLPAGPGLTDLPAPKGPGTLSDLPAPKRAAAPPVPPARRADDIVDLPTVRGPAGIPDLPMPKVGAGDLPAPKGFFDDLPQPALPSTQTKTDLPAPKGFFDDLPARKSTTEPPKSKPELPAPKGFFDDLPGRVNPHGKVEKPEVPAPKGFFDDLPGRVNPNKPEAPAPKGFFDDLPQPSKKPFDSPRPQPPSQAPAFDPLTQDPFAPADLPLDLPSDIPELDLGSVAKPLPLPPPPAPLAAPPPIPAADASFDDLDLSKPSAAPVRMDTARRTPMSPKQASAGADPLPTLGKSGDVSLELEEPREKPQKRLEPKRTRAVDDSQPSTSRTRSILTVVLLLAVLGGGGFFVWKKFFDKPARPVQNPAEDVGRAKAAIASCSAEHWDVAASAAGAALGKDPTHKEALAIGAEAQFGSALARGVGGPNRIALAREYLTTAAKVGVTGPTIQRAQALAAIAANNPDGAIEPLKSLVAQNPKDAALLLYLGWAHATRGDQPEAIKTFDQAADIGVEGCKLYALYGRAQAKLAQNDLAGARADFDAVYQLDKDNLGAQIGIAAAVPASQAQQQEEDLRAILARKDVELADPRAVLLGYVLWGESARRANRFDVARDRYRKALALAPNDLRVLAGLAEIEMQDGKLEAAAELLTQALALAKDDVRAQLVQAELSILQKNFDDATARLEALVSRTPAPPAMEMARIKLVYGKLFEAGGDDDKAIAAYEEAAKLAGESDLVPTLAAVKKLLELADKASSAKDTARAAELRERANALLGALATNAEKDPQVALTLGTAYLQAADPAKAEPWLRRVVEARPSDAEGQYQLAKALARLDKTDDAITRLQKASSLAPNRADIGTELARTYEALGRDSEAAAIYNQLVAGKDPGAEIRARAGKFYARTGDITKAAEQGAKILEVDPDHGAGMYLKGEGLLAAGKVEDARQMFLKAVEADQDPMYLDAQGRAAEAIAKKDGDSRNQDAAIRAYQAAIAANPKMFNPHAGLGRLYLARHEAGKAVTPLGDAYKIREDPEVAYNMGLAYKELQDLKTAAAWFKETLKRRPSAEGSYQLGQIYVGLDQGREAVAQFDAAVRGGTNEEKRTGKVVPWLTDALYTLGDLQKSLNNLGAACEAWLRYVDRGDVPPGVKLQSVKRAIDTSLRCR